MTGRHRQPPTSEIPVDERLYTASRKERALTLQRRGIGRLILATDDGAVYGFYETKDAKVGIFAIDGALGKHRGTPEEYTSLAGERGAVLTPVTPESDITGYQILDHEGAAHPHNISVTKIADGSEIGKMTSYVFRETVGIFLDGGMGATLYQPMEEPNISSDSAPANTAPLLAAPEMQSPVAESAYPPEHQPRPLQVI